MRENTYLLLLLGGLEEALAPLDSPLTVITDCAGPKHGDAAVNVATDVNEMLVSGSGAEAPIFALLMMFGAVGCKHLVHHLSCPQGCY